MFDELNYQQSYKELKKNILTFMNIDLSILIPVRDEEENVKIIYNDIKNKITCTNYELLFVNDFSTDLTTNVLDEITQQDKKIKYINNHRKGLGGAISLGIKKSQGKYICIMISQSESVVGLILRVL